MDQRPSPAVFSPSFAALALAGLCAAVYFQVAGHSFVNYDDFEYVSRNPFIERGLTLEAVRWAFVPGDDWMPLTKLSHMLVFQFFGARPWAHHLANLLFHAANAVLLFYVLRLWTGDDWRSAVAAMLFAVHPMQAEAVSWVTARKDLLSAFFGLFTFLAYLRLPRKPGVTRMALVCFLFFLSLASKPTLVALPFLLVFTDKKLFQNKWPLYLLSALFCAITLGVQHQALSYSSQTPLVFRVPTSILFYIQKILFPHPLAIYGHVPDAAVAPGVAAAALCVLAGISALAFFQRKKFPFFLAGWCWFLLCLAPVSVLEVPADRYVYFAMIGLGIAAVFSIPGKWLAGSIAVAAVWAPLAFVQSGYWKNSATLFGHTLAVNDRNYSAHVNFAETLVDEGRADEAAAHYRRALGLSPQNAEALASLGVLYEKTNDLVQAERLEREALRARPENAQAHFNLGNVLRKKGKNTEAVEHFMEAARLKSDFAQSAFNAACALEEEGKTEDAARWYLQAIRIKPDYAGARNNLGLLFLAGKRYAEAIAQFSEILKKDGANVESGNNLAIALARSGNYPAAIARLQKILRDHPDAQDTRANLALLYSKAGGKA